MTLLLPELERQLRDAIDAHLDPEAPRRRRAWPGAVWIAFAGSAALVVAVVVVILAGHGGHGTRLQTAGASSGGLACGRPPLLKSSVPHGPFETVATGSIDGHSWSLQSGHAGNSVLDGRLVLDGRPYGFCAAAVAFQLIDAQPHGLVYGLASRGLQSLTLAGSRPSYESRQRGYTFFIQVLPHSACGYRSLTLSAFVRSSHGGRTDLVQNYYGACKPGQLVAPALPPRMLPNGSILVAPVHRGLSHAKGLEFVLGDVVAAQAGCLACHRIGANGNNGPGPNLTNIGRLLNPSTIRATLVNPTAPMPSFRNLPRKSLRALAYFLSQLGR